jgi:glutamyl-tRNA reductase
VDDLKAVVAANQARRQRLVLEAEEVLREELKNFGACISIYLSIYLSIYHRVVLEAEVLREELKNLFC